MTDVEITRLYREEGWGITKLAKHSGISAWKIRAKLIRLGILESSRQTPRKVPPTDVLEKMYVERDMGTHAIARELGVTAHAVYRALSLAGIIDPERTSAGRCHRVKGVPREKLPEAVLIEELIVQRLSLYAIAQKHNMQRPALAERVKRLEAKGKLPAGWRDA